MVRRVSLDLVTMLQRELKIQPYQRGRILELQEYLEAKGPEALIRQIELGKTHYRCCWAHIDEPHHPGCPVGAKAA